METLENFLQSIPASSGLESGPTEVASDSLITAPPAQAEASATKPLIGESGEVLRLTAMDRAQGALCFMRNQVVPHG
eukprot:1972917-Amphidinium_carterae.1